MELPRIAALDLRPPQPPTREEWDWPELPSFLKRRVVEVVFIVDTSGFRGKPWNPERPPSKPRPLWRDPWYRRIEWHSCCIVAGLILALAVCLWVVLDTWL